MLCTNSKLYLHTIPLLESDTLISGILWNSSLEIEVYKVLILNWTRRILKRKIYIIFQLHTHEVVEVCAKILYQVELQRNTLEQMWGFSVEAELIENSDRQDELCCYVSRVEDKSVAMQNGNFYISRWRETNERLSSDRLRAISIHLSNEKTVAARRI